ncbi:putative Xaa-Pro aminopeptidase [Saccharata proteae CBS 121410]|uniref:Xaa-Pro aminopeptidase n=1 Tax=Saccharata proteae CBS 121410 TaxID=1314787 RepID=A0A9P4HT12_9PEZI|nr:putative Xaa-Pro aminopeptidase [Saccharata proteae CBS 121410]
MTAIDPAQLSDRLQDVEQDFWVHIESSTPLDKYPAKDHARRVARLLDVDKGLIYLAGAPTAYLEDSDQFIPFRQRRYFYYLSGVDEPDCHLTYDIEKDLLRLYVPEVDPQKTIWFGRGSTIDEALDKYDVDTASWSIALVSDIETWARRCKGDIFILHRDQGVSRWRFGSPRVNYQRLQVAIDIARVRKDAHEIKLIKKANEISAKAHTNVLTNIHRYTNETEVEATFLDTSIAEGAKNQAYSIIAASGENAATLHYVKNDESLKGRQLMCLDAGAEWQCYASDVTRTFPLTGSWPSIEAKQIYDLVEEMQNTVISMLAPGVRFLNMHYIAHHIAISGLLRLRILHNGTKEEIFGAGTSRAFFPHGLGHHVGLEVHDVSGVPLMARASNFQHAVYDAELCKSPVDPNSNALEEGMVVTVEPGIYFSSVALAQYLESPIHSKYINKDILQRYLPVGGVRIEDDILITETGYENLTTAPKGEAMLDIIKSIFRRGITRRF